MPTQSRPRPATASLSLLPKVIGRSLPGVPSERALIRDGHSAAAVARSRCRPAAARRPRRAARGRRRRCAMPPAAMIAMSGPTRSRSSRSTSVARALSGAPESPPAPARSTCSGLEAQARAADGGVGGHDAVEAQLERQVGDVEQVLVREVGGDLHQQRQVPVGDRVRAPSYGVQQRPEPRGRLQVAQPGGVRRADVDHQVVGVRREQAGALLVVGDRLVLGDRPWSCRCSRRRPRRGACARAASASRRATTSAPSLLKPIRFTTARSAGSRNSRGRGLPGCGSPVTVPTSTNANPSAASASMPTAFLSKPAASPSGPGKSSPITCSGADAARRQRPRHRGADLQRP